MNNVLLLLFVLHTVEPLNVDSLKCKNLHIQDTFVKSHVLIYPWNEDI